MLTGTEAKLYIVKPVLTKRPPVNVLHIIKSLGRGGAETLLSETLLGHSKEDFNFHYIFFLPWKNQMVQEITDAGGTVTCVPANNNVQIFLKLRTIIKYIRDNKIQLIHCHLPITGVLGRLAGKISGVPIIYTEHNTWERYHKMTYWLNKFSFSKQDKVIAVSKEVARSIKANYHKKLPEVQVIANGVDTSKFSRKNIYGKDICAELGIPFHATIVGIACVFRAQKRLDHWLDIAAKVHEQLPAVHFLIVGDGVLREEVFARAKELKTDAYVHFAGMQPEVMPYFKVMDVFMMTSDFEGLPLALLEAMSMGCMPACTSAGGISEVINDGVNGILVPLGEPELLADRLIECLQDVSQLERMKQEARKTVVSSFDMKKMIVQLEAIYHTTLRKKMKA